MESALEAEDLDIEEMLATGALLVEWPERIQGALPKDCLQVEMGWVADEQRRMKFTPVGKRAEELAREFKKLAFGG